jgi:hypothetical protein
MRIHILWPERRSVDVAQIHLWASDDLANEENRRVISGKLTDAQALAIVSFHGNVTIARGHGLDLPDYSPGDIFEGCVFGPAFEE